MNEGYSSKLTAHSVERSKQSKDFVLFCECKIKVSNTGVYGKHGRACRGNCLVELNSPTSSPIVMSLTIFSRKKGLLDKKLLLYVHMYRVGRK